MINKLVPNQKAIRIKKEKSGKENLYSIVNLAAQKEAMITLKPNAFKVWCWLNSNQDNYEFGLSGKVVQEECNISKGTYDTAIKELKEKKYLVETELYEGLKGYVFYEGGYSVGQNLSNEDINLPPLDKNYPTVGQNLSNAVGQNLSNTLAKNYPRNITDTTTNNTDRLQEQSIVLSEKLEVIVKQFSNSEAARKSFKQLLDCGKTEEWIIAAVENKRTEIFEKYGFGLLFKSEYQNEINSLIAKKEQETKAAEEWEKAMFNQSSENIQTPDLFLRKIVIECSGIKQDRPNRRKQLGLINLDEIAAMA